MLLYFCILLKLIKRYYFEETTFLVESRNQDMEEWRKLSIEKSGSVSDFGAQLTLITSPVLACPSRILWHHRLLYLLPPLR